MYLFNKSGSSLILFAAANLFLSSFKNHAELPNT